MRLLSILLATIGFLIVAIEISHLLIALTKATEELILEFNRSNAIWNEKNSHFTLVSNKRA
jgi:hypothetical protein